MQGDQERWDALHSRGHAGLDPSAFLAALLPHLQGAASSGARLRALDLACGKGPDSLLLARAGYEVEAWDVSPIALRVLSERASAEGLEARLELRCVDLSTTALPEAAYDLVLCRRFLDRARLGAIRGAARRGGVVVLETFTEEQARHPGGPKNPDHLLRYGEVRTLLPAEEFRILRWYEEGGELDQRSLAGVAGRRL